MIFFHFIYIDTFARLTQYVCTPLHCLPILPLRFKYVSNPDQLLLKSIDSQSMSNAVHMISLPVLPLSVEGEGGSDQQLLDRVQGSLLQYAVQIYFFTVFWYNFF